MFKMPLPVHDMKLTRNVVDNVLCHSSCSSRFVVATDLCGYLLNLTIIFHFFEIGFVTKTFQ